MIRVQALSFQKLCKYSIIKICSDFPVAMPPVMKIANTNKFHLWTIYMKGKTWSTRILCYEDNV
jgi:hypothetical protein